MTAITASAMADNLISYLRTSASSAFGTANVSKTNWGILDTSPCVNNWMVLPPPFDSDILAMDDPAPRTMTYSFRVRCLTRDVGNAEDSLQNAWKAAVDLQTAIEATNNMSGSCQMIQFKRGDGWDGETFLGTPDRTYIPQNFYIEIFTL